MGTGPLMCCLLSLQKRQISMLATQNTLDLKIETITKLVPTAAMSIAQLDALKAVPLQLPPYSPKTQSCERSVKLALRQLRQGGDGQRGMALLQHRCAIKK